MLKRQRLGAFWRLSNQAKQRAKSAFHVMLNLLIRTTGSFAVSNQRSTSKARGSLMTCEVRYETVTAYAPHEQFQASFWVCYKSCLTADSGVALREIQSLRERESLWEESILILCSELCYLCNKKLESISQTDQSIPLICAGQCKLAEPCN